MISTMYMSVYIQYHLSIYSHRIVLYNFDLFIYYDTPYQLYFENSAPGNHTTDRSMEPQLCDHMDKCNWSHNDTD